MTKKYPHSDKIKSILDVKADFIQNEGLNYLIPTWKRFADQYADTEEDIYEWLNELDTRNIIDEILTILSESERTLIETELKPIDSIVLGKTFEVNECVWGKKAEKDNNYNRRKHWYYFIVNQPIFNNEKGKFTKLN